MNKTFSEIGTFEVKSGVMRISDLCYQKDTWCAGTISPCRKGTWTAAVVYDNDGYVLMLVVKSASIKGNNLFDHLTVDENRYSWNEAVWEMADIDVGVDSGQCGFFDDEHFLDNEIFQGCSPAKSQYGDAFYNHCCDATLSDSRAGVIPYGVVSSSGYGDGSYRAFIHKNTKGDITAATIIF